MASFLQALAHRYLKDLHHPDDEPDCPEPFDLGFEKEYPAIDDEGTIPQDILQDIVYEDVLYFQDLEDQMLSHAEGLEI